MSVIRVSDQTVS